MIRMTIAVGMAAALAGCAANPKDGEVVVDGVRQQPVALSTDADPGLCSARAVLLHSSRLSSGWSASVETPATLHLPRNARVVELVCAAAAGGEATTRYLVSEETDEAKTGQLATGAMFLLFGGLPALATGAAQRTDVYAFPATFTVALPPTKSANPSDRAAYADRRVEEIGRDTEEWRRVRMGLCEVESSPGERVVDPHCERGLDEVAKRREALITELQKIRTAQN